MSTTDDMVNQAIDGVPQPGQAYDYKNLPKAQPSDEELGIVGMAGPPNSFQQYQLRKKATDEGWDEDVREQQENGGIPQDYSVPSANQTNPGTPLIGDLNADKLGMEIQGKQEWNEDYIPSGAGYSDGWARRLRANKLHIKDEDMNGENSEMSQFLARLASGRGTKEDMMKYLNLTGQKL